MVKVYLNHTPEMDRICKSLSHTMCVCISVHACTMWVQLNKLFRQSRSPEPGRAILLTGTHLKGKISSVSFFFFFQKRNWKWMLSWILISDTRKGSNLENWNVSLNEVRNSYFNILKYKNTTCYLWNARLIQLKKSI